MALAVLSYFFQTLISVVEAVVGQILEVFMISGLLGSYVVFYATVIVELLLFVVDTVFNLIKILCEDFLIFLYDVIVIILGIADILSSLLTFAIEASLDILNVLREMVIYILMLPICLYYMVLSVLEYIVLFLVDAANLFKRSLTLIGTSIWVAIMFLPYSLVNLAHLSALSCVIVARSVYDLILSFITGTSSRVCDIGYKLVHFFVDIPCEACGGLAIIVLLIWLIYKEQHAIQTFCVDVYRLHLKAVMILIQLVRYPCQYLIQQADLYRRHYVIWKRERISPSDVGDEIFSRNGIDPSASTSQQGDNSNYLLNLKKKLEKEIEEKMCSVCQERRKTIIVLPCRHLCMCEECVLIVERVSRKCPLCRRHIAKTMGVYL